MSVRPILTGDASILRQKARRVKLYNQALCALVEDMFETMHQAHGVGLAAPQIGIPQRLIIIEIPADEETGRPDQSYVLCNPQLVRSGGEETDEEGCLSLPGLVGEVKRAASVTVKGFTVEGKPIRVKGEGLLARVLQHEMDHLDGVLFVDRLESLDKLRRVSGEEEGPPAA